LIHQLRPYQVKAVDDIRESYRKGFEAPLLVMPTGSGKTVVFTDIATKAAGKDNRTLVVVHRSYLWQQVWNKLLEIGAKLGVIAPKQLMTNDHIQVASVDTLIRRLNRVKKPDIIIFDEAHHVIKGNKWGKVVDYFPESKILGVTATPIRTNGHGLGVNSGGYFDTLISGPQIYDLMPDYIVPFKLYAPNTGIDLTGVKRIGGDFSKKDLLERIDKRTITGSATDQYMKICPGVPAIAFCVSVAHAEHVAQSFNAIGVTSAAVSGKTPENRRKYLFEGLASGKFKVLCSCDLVSEGFDVPVCGAAICLRPTQSTGLCLQQWGRATRPAPGKEFAYIIDHVGNYLRHGLPDQFRDWDLDGIKNIDGKKDTTVGIRTCTKCFHIHKTAPVCPECGYVYGVMDKTPEQVEGELEEVKLREVEIKKEKRVEQGRCTEVDDLVKLGISKGYTKYNAKKWAGHIINSRKRKKKVGRV